jgi:hypothetical protein
MTDATGGRRHYNCQWTQEDEETLYNLINNNKFMLYRTNIFTLYCAAQLPFSGRKRRKRDYSKECYQQDGIR